MKTSSFSEGREILNNGRITGRLLQDRASAQVIEMRLEPGADLKDHTTPVDVIFYLLEGSLEMRVGGEIRSLSAGTLVESPAGIPHGFANGETVSRLLVIKTPRPE